ncbi:MAG: hypothetical protein RLZZ301_434 [Bacteroidota bacterium]|jgi:ComF family protein
MVNYFRQLGLVVKRYQDGLQHLVFTNVCLHCDQELSSTERYLCWKCTEHLRHPYFERQLQTSAADQLFWGRVDMNYVASLYYYEKQGACQSLLRALKYDFKAPLGLYLGAQMADYFQAHPMRDACDALLPVPIHPRKKFARGYNQSELLARGIASQWKKPVLTDWILKNKHTRSQTRSDRFGRWDNVHSLFSARPIQIPFQHVLIIDDVITTGATVESLARTILAANPSIQISLLSFAFTK